VTWGSDHKRMSELPSNWDTLRLDVFDRDGWRCTWKLSDGRRCEIKDGLECDHVGRNDDHSMSNLRTLCGPHHGIRTGIQGAAARRAKKAAAKLPAEDHPGWL
jgi:5-methylcytosine-specific restriction protein A